MNRSAKVYMQQLYCGRIFETDSGYSFEYDVSYLANTIAKPISKNLPLQNTSYTSNTLFPFFDGLIPEGWLLDIAHNKWNIKQTDRMGLLLACCKDCIGAVSIEDEKL